MPVKKAAKKNLFYAPDVWCFWVSDGRILRSLVDLRDGLKEMSDEVFKNHVNKEKNDFAKWIEDILGESVFAKKMRTMKTRLTALRTVESELKKYQI